GVPPQFDDRLCALDPVHAHVHEDDVGVGNPECSYHLVAVGAFVHHFEVAAWFENQAQAVANQALVVDQHHSDGRLDLVVGDFGGHQSRSSRPVRCKKTCSRSGSLTSIAEIVTSDDAAASMIPASAVPPSAAVTCSPSI